MQAHCAVYIKNSLKVLLMTQPAEALNGSELDVGTLMCATILVFALQRKARH